jgi:WD40 repeat protein
MAWSPDGKLFAAGIANGDVLLWQLGSGKLLRNLQAHTGIVLTVAWSPDSKSLASGSNDQTVRLWQVETGKLEHTLQAKVAVGVVAWSPDGKSLASTGLDGVLLWEAESGKRLHTLRTPGTIQALAWSPDGHVLASGETTGTVRLWNPASGQPVDTLKGHQYGVLALVWLPDGKTLASLGDDRTIRLWDARSGEPLRTFPGLGQGIFSPDGRMLATWGPWMVPNLQLWDTKTGRPRGTLVPLRDEQYLVVSPEGHYRGTRRIERELVYVVQTDHGQDTLTPEEFAQKYGWKNDPDRVRLADR